MPPLAVKPMDAVVALYSDGDHALAGAIIDSLSRAIFSDGHVPPAGLAQRILARISYQALKWTTTRRGADYETGDAGTFANPILERSGHPYAEALLNSSCKETEALVEGGDPMNGPYMMISPEILKVSDIWDRLLLHSVQGRDVQLRFIWETKATYEEARSRLEKGGAIRMKAVAAGTGLSMILTYDRLIKDGYDPARLTVRIADRDKANAEKTGRLLAKLNSTRSRVTGAETAGGISVGTEDLFADEPASGASGAEKYDVVTAVGILEYFQGFTSGSTERCLGLPHVEEETTAHHLAEKLDTMTADTAALIVNTYRPHASTRILELFGRRFDYRHRENLSELLATVNFRNPRLVGSGNIYDVKVYEKGPA